MCRSHRVSNSYSHRTWHTPHLIKLMQEMYDWQQIAESFRLDGKVSTKYCMWPWLKVMRTKYKSCASYQALTGDNNVCINCSWTMLEKKDLYWWTSTKVHSTSDQLSSMIVVAMNTTQGESLEFAWIKQQYELDKMAWLTVLVLLLNLWLWVHCLHMTFNNVTLRDTDIVTLLPALIVLWLAWCLQSSSMCFTWATSWVLLLHILQCRAPLTVKLTLLNPIHTMCWPFFKFDQLQYTRAWRHSYYVNGELLFLV